ncbi:STAS domain-containing protein [Streptomyces sp. NPDC000983]|uniref:STAS domain-containing protein n=1 Tax=Streptomyces sp. NPDC000983 TaxID=3154373 RepID=UPI0033270B85
MTAGTGLPSDLVTFITDDLAAVRFALDCRAALSDRYCARRIEEPMSHPRLSVHRHDRGPRALLTLAGEIDLATAPLVRSALTTCRRDGVRATDVDLKAVTFCDVSGLNAFLMASMLARDAGTTFQLLRSPTALLRIIEITGTGFLLHELHGVTAPSRRNAADTHGAA